MAETKGFGTTNVLVISKLGAVLGADSRITSYENEILSETSKCGVLYSDGVGSTHALWSWAGDQVEAVQFIENLEQAVAIMSNNNKIRATIETTAATELNKTYFKQGVQSFILTFESKITAGRGMPLTCTPIKVWVLDGWGPRWESECHIIGILQSFGDI